VAKSRHQAAGGVDAPHPARAMTALWRLAGGLRLYSANGRHVGGLRRVYTERGGRGSLDARQSAGASPISHQYIVSAGKLRAALIASNPVLVTRRPDGTLGGVSVAVARALATHLGVPVELKPYDNPARYNESLATDDWDIGLAARDPSRAEHLAFSVTFMEVDNGYVARPGAAPTNAEEVDRPGVKVAVAQDSAPLCVPKI